MTHTQDTTRAPKDQRQGTNEARTDQGAHTDQTTTQQRDTTTISPTPTTKDMRDKVAPADPKDIQAHLTNEKEARPTEEPTDRRMKKEKCTGRSRTSRRRWKPTSRIKQLEHDARKTKTSSSKYSCRTHRTPKQHTTKKWNLDQQEQKYTTPVNLSGQQNQAH